MTDVFTALVGAIANCIGPENCQKCEYRDIRTKTRCKTMLLRDALELLNAQEPQTVSGWVSVKDRMPEPEENVIIWTKTGCMRYAQYHEDGSVNPWYVYEDNARAWTNVISHWMPLPEPPEEDNA